MDKNKVYHLDFIKNTLPDKCANLIICDPPYFEVKGEFDFIWDSFEDYLKDVEVWAKECKRLLADNGTLFWWGDAKKIAYSQVIIDKYFKLLNNLVWENTTPHKQQIRFSKGLRSFAPVTERLLMYSNDDIGTGLDLIMEQHIKPKHPFALYLKAEFKRANITRKQVSKLFPSKTGNLTGCVSNWLNGDNTMTKEQYLKVKKWLGGDFLRKEYEELRKEYEELRKEYEELRRPFENTLSLGDVFHFANNSSNKYKHPTKKPPKLTRVLIQTCSRKGDLLIVPFAGSGTECAMGIEEGLDVIGFDIEAKYVDMSNKRIKRHQKQQKLF